MAGGSKEERLAAMRASDAAAAPDLAGDDDAPRVEHAPWLPGTPPVTPLGQLGGKLVFLDRAQQVVITGTDCKKGDLKLWFGNEYLLTHYNQTDKKGNPTGKFDQDDAQTALVEACAARGIFNPQGKVLGRGAHAPVADPNALVLHIGRAVLIARAGEPVRKERAGRVTIAGKDLFFPADSALEPPAREPSHKADGEALLALFEKWEWVDRKAMPGLLLGWVAQAFICGAMDWRAHIWLPGPTASGKTTLQKIIRALLDDWVLKTADASEAAIRQVLRNDTLAVSIDEAEKHDNPERLQAVMNLLKKSSSGEVVLRGSADHKAQEFTAQSCFLLSSVLHATMRGEDRNRIALLELRPLPEGTPELDLNLSHWRTVGRAMHRRMIEQWPRFAKTLDCYRRAIAAQRFDSRWQDTYGTLLACADLLLHDSAPASLDFDGLDESGMGRVNRAVADILPLIAKGRSEARTDTERAIVYLMSKALPGAHGMPPEPIGTWLARAMAIKFTPGEFETDAGSEGPDEAARDKLKSHGMRVIQPFEVDDGRGGKKISWRDALLDEAGWLQGYLALAYSGNAALQELWKGTEWSGDGYLQSLRKVPGVEVRKVRFSGAGTDNALLVPLRAFRGDEG